MKKLLATLKAIAKFPFSFSIDLKSTRDSGGRKIPFSISFKKKF